MVAGRRKVGHGCPHCSRVWLGRRVAPYDMPAVMIKSKRLRDDAWHTRVLHNATTWMTGVRVGGVVGVGNHYTNDIASHPDVNVAALFLCGTILFSPSFSHTYQEAVRWTHTTANFG